MKTCSRCKNYKAFSEFGPHASHKDKLQNYCYPCGREYGRNWHRTHKDRSRNNWYKRKYNITLDDYKNLQRFQSNRCLICLTEALPNRFLDVDHDHITKKARALLCDKCNKGLGCFGENPDILKRATQYAQSAVLSRIVDAI